MLFTDRLADSRKARLGISNILVIFLAWVSRGSPRVCLHIKRLTFTCAGGGISSRLEVLFNLTMLVESPLPTDTGKLVLLRESPEPLTLPEDAGLSLRADTAPLPGAAKSMKWRTWRMHKQNEHYQYQSERRARRLC